MRSFFGIKNVKCYTYSVIDSTNNEAVRRIKKGLKAPTLITAKSQTAGKGTRGRSFYSKGGGLYMSLALKVDDAHLQKLTVLAAVATAKSIEKLSGKEVGIKWVNDIYLDGKKVCGILCERVENAVVIGVGVNLSVKAFPDEIKNIAANIGNINRRKLAKNITNEILRLLETKEDFIPYYKNKSVLLGKEISYLYDGAEYKGVAVDIDDMGGLVVETNGEKKTLTSGDVMLLK